MGFTHYQNEINLKYPLSLHTLNSVDLKVKQVYVTLMKRKREYICYCKNNLYLPLNITSAVMLIDVNHKMILHVQ